MADSITPVSVTVGTAALLADVSGLLGTYPLVSFVGMGGIGGVAGWALAMDRGELDAASWRAILCLLSRRLLLGGCIGVATFVWWSDAPQNQGLWTMAVGLAAIDPVRAVKVVWDRFLEMLPKGAR